METGQIVWNSQQKQGFQPLWDGQGKDNHSELVISDLVVKPIYDFEQDITIYVPMLYKALVQVYPELQDIEVVQTDANYLMNVIINFLKDKINLYDINFVEADKGKKYVSIYKSIKVEENTIFALFLKKIKPLSYMNPNLFKATISFFKKIDLGRVKSNENFAYTLDIVDMELKENGLSKKEKSILKSNLKNLLWLENQLDNADINDFDFLYSYKPKNPKYKALTELLLKYAAVDFSKLYDLENLTAVDLFLVDDSEPIEFSKLFFTLYEDDQLSNEYIFSNIQTLANEYGMIPPLDSMIIDQEGNIIKNFIPGMEIISEIIDFVYAFNDLNI